MATELLVGIDLGTSVCKAAAVSPAGRELAHGSAPTPWRRVPTGAEADPWQLADAALAAAAAAVAAVDGAHVLAVGVTSMAETGALLGPAGEPVAPAIAWHDERGDDEAAAFAGALGLDRFSARVGLPATRLCTLAKYAWMRAHLPASATGARWLNLAEWVVHRLGGAQVAELSLASRTGLLDLGTRGWWDEALAWAGAPPGLLPEPQPAGTPAGHASSGPARAAGLGGAVLTVAGHDHLCAAVGAGATRPDEVFDSCGTAEALVRGVAPLEAAMVVQAVAADVTVSWHVVPGLQALLASNWAGLALQRFLALLGVGPEQRDALEAAALAVPAGALGMRVLDPDTDAAAIAGIGREPTPALVWRAAVEAVTERTAGLLDAVRRLGGEEVTRLVIAGGWARSPTLRAVKAARLGRLDHSPVTEPGARGAALLAGLAAGMFEDVADLPAPEAA